MPPTKETSPDSLYTIVKGRFKAIDTNTFGLLLVTINNNVRVVENINIIASHFSSMYETEPRSAWSEMEDRILSLKWRGEYAQSISRDMYNFIDGSLKSDRGDELYVLLRQNAVAKIEALFTSLLMKPLGDKNIHIELAWEKVSAEQMRIVKEERDGRDSLPGEEQDSPMSAPAAEAQPEAADLNLEDGAVLLDVDLILAPVSGIPIFELQSSDRIMVKINPATNRGRYFIDLLNAMHDNEVVPIPGTVTEIKINKFNEYVILVKIGEGIYGKAIEPEQVKLKRYDPVNDKKTAQNAMRNLAAAGFNNPLASQVVSKEDKSISALYWVMYLGGFVVLAAILVIVIFAL